MRRGLEIRPITFKEASDFVNKHHRHHRATVECKKRLLHIFSNARTEQVLKQAVLFATEVQAVLTGRESETEDKKSQVK